VTRSRHGDRRGQDRRYPENRSPEGEASLRAPERVVTDVERQMLGDMGSVAEGMLSRLLAAYIAIV
jgi:hypothetical protein